jgi:hypothetical protein
MPSIRSSLQPPASPDRSVNPLFSKRNGCLRQDHLLQFHLSIPCVYLSRHLGKSLVFIAVVELQSNGTPHLHLLVGSYIHKSWINTSWQALGGGCATRIEYADVHRVAAYLSKYFTDESLRDLPDGTRRFSTSHGLALFERTKSDGSWILSRSPIDYCSE